MKGEALKEVGWNILYVPYEKWTRSMSSKAQVESHFKQSLKELVEKIEID